MTDQPRRPDLAGALAAERARQQQASHDRYADAHRRYAAKYERLDDLARLAIERPAEFAALDLPQRQRTAATVRAEHLRRRAARNQEGNRTA